MFPLPILPFASLLTALPAPSSWTFDPLAVLFLLALLGGYLALVGPLRERYRLGEPVSLARRVWFVVGWLTLALSVISPLDGLGRYYLLSAHTLQLLVITTVAAPLLLYGIPEWAVWRVLPARALRNATRGLTFSIVAVLGFNFLVLFWYVGPFLEAAQHFSGIHDLQNLCFLVAGILTWWPLLTPLDRHTRMSTPVQMLYLVVESLPLDIFGVAMLFIQRLFFPLYETAPRIFGITPMVDQYIAGALLAAPGNIIDICLMSVIFFKWIADVERKQNAREREEAEREIAELEARTLAHEAAQANAESSQG